MASHHHHHNPHPYHHCHHLNSHPTAATTTSTPCCCCCPPSHYPPPADPIVQSIISHLLRPPPQPYPYSPYPGAPYTPHTHRTQYPPPQIHQQNQKSKKHHHHPQYQEDEQTEPNVSSLLHRIAALESSLHRRSSATFPLRDAAARTIQAHFRAFLVRRSRTLRQLKDLAFIKSSLNALKSSLSDKMYFDSRTLSRKAMDLLVKLDSIQGVDLMIREGKRSISRELIPFLKLLDEVSVKRREVAVKNLKCGGNRTKSRVFEREERIRPSNLGVLAGDERELEKLKEQLKKFHGSSRVCDEEEEEIEHGVSQNKRRGLLKRYVGVQAKMKKNVSFADNGNVYRVFPSSHGPISSGDFDSTDERELLDNLCRGVEEIGVPSKECEDDEETHTEDEGSFQNSDDERGPRRNLGAGGDYGMRKHDQEGDGSFVFSAPLPVKMEARADFMNKKSVK